MHVKFRGWLAAAGPVPGVCTSEASCVKLGVTNRSMRRTAIVFRDDSPDRDEG